MIHAACWAHARRKFFQAVELNPKDQAAIGIVARIVELFSIEAQARDHRLSQEERQLARRQKSGPVLEQIKSQVQSARTDALPKSVLARACNYTLSLWTRLNRFMKHPHLELSNNLAENAMRPLALGRRNWIHIGSEQAGPRVAAIVSVIETCRRLNIPVRDYLCSTLPGLADFPINRISELTPASWLTRN
jgi:predicted pyridoxine 5'-phosphate oxidase superfamily flavin-nucleotide-binding protein